MNELNLDAESVTRNKSYGPKEHLHHLIKIGWSSNSPLIKNFLKENNLTEDDLRDAISKVTEANSTTPCINRQQ